MTKAVKKCRILIIDDDSDFSESLHLRLMMDGYDVLTLPDGTDAVRQYGEFKPDIVFLDVRMPNISGYDVFLRLKAHSPDAKIYFTSGYALDEEEYAVARSKSLAGIITKPIDSSVLQKVLDSICQGHI